VAKQKQKKRAKGAMNFTFPPLTMVMKNKKKGGNEDPTNGWCDEIK
jgi:hypothetical protein